MTTYKIIPLKWEPGYTKGEELAHIANGAYYQIRISPYTGKLEVCWNWADGVDEGSNDNIASIEAGKVWADADYIERVTAFLEPGTAEPWHWEEVQ